MTATEARPMERAGSAADRAENAPPEASLLRGAQERQADSEAESETDGRLKIERIAGLPVQLDVHVPLPDFRVADLLRLSPGDVVVSAWPSSEDVPLNCDDVQLVWTEFEVVDQTLAVRVTRLV